MRYTRICEDAGLHNDASYGSEAHMRSMWKLAEGRLMGAVAGMDATNGRWWTVDAEARQKRPLRPFEALLLDYVGFRGKWYGVW